MISKGKQNAREEMQLLVDKFREEGGTITHFSASEAEEKPVTVGSSGGHEYAVDEIEAGHPRITTGCTRVKPMPTPDSF